LGFITIHPDDPGTKRPLARSDLKADFSVPSKQLPVLKTVRLATATGDHDGFVVQGIVDVRQSGVGTWGRLVDLHRTLHVQSFVRTFVVEDLDKLVEAGLLL